MLTKIVIIINLYSLKIFMGVVKLNYGYGCKGKDIYIYIYI